MSAAGTRESADNSIGGTYWTGEQHLIKTVPHWTILRMNYYAESMAEEIQMSVGMNVLTGLGDERVAVIDAVAEIKRTFVQGYFDILTSDIERLSGRAPQSFRNVLTAMLSKGGTR